MDRYELAAHLARKAWERSFDDKNPTLQWTAEELRTIWEQAFLAGLKYAETHQSGEKK